MHHVWHRHLTHSLAALAAQVGALRRVTVALAKDGAAAEVSGLQLLSCVLCAARPDRLAEALYSLREPLCWKKRLEAWIRPHTRRTPTPCTFHAVCC